MLQSTQHMADNWHDWRHLEDKKGPKSQAERILQKFGGPRAFLVALKHVDPDQILAVSSVYRWLYPVDKGGTGGIIPTHVLPAVVRAARFEGILLTERDFYPGEL